MYVHTVLGGIKQRLICIDRASDVLMKHTACHCTVHSFASCLDHSVFVTCQHIAVYAYTRAPGVLCMALNTA